MSGVLIAVIVAGLTNGAVYALATLGLSLVWGSMRMLNMAHASLLTLGGYIAFSVVTAMGLPIVVGVVAAMLVGAVAGAIVYGTLVVPMLKKPTAVFETNIFIATVGAGIALENAILLTYGGQPLKQPVSVEGAISLPGGGIPFQSLMIVLVSIGLMAVTAFILARTRFGRAVRATAQNRDAAQLMGVPVQSVYLQVLMLSGALAAACGILVSAITQLSPTLGADPALKAFIMCVVAGLGNLPGAIIASFALALIEAFVQYAAGARWGFPVLLFIVIAVLIWKPSGLFGRAQIRRL
jgi:branched-chain amino acid transport system permease protein